MSAYLKQKNSVTEFLCFYYSEQQFKPRTKKQNCTCSIYVSEKFKKNFNLIHIETINIVINKNKVLNNSKTSKI